MGQLLLGVFQGLDGDAVDECDPTVAEMVVANLDVANTEPMKDGFADLKAAVEGTYECLGLTCEDIGTYQTSAGPYPGMDGCAGPSGALVPIAGYLPATDVVPHAMIDLDQQEISAAAGEGTDAGFAEAIRVYQQGGGGTCTASDVADEAINQCNAVGDPKGNSVKGSGAIRTIEGFATSGPSKMMAEETYLMYKDYWGDEKYCDTFVMNAYNSKTMDAYQKIELIKKGTPYQCVRMYVLHEFERRQRRRRRRRRQQLRRRAGPPRVPPRGARGARCLRALDATAPFPSPRPTKNASAR